MVKVILYGDPTLNPFPCLLWKCADVTKPQMSPPIEKGNDAYFKQGFYENLSEMFIQGFLIHSKSLLRRTFF